MSLDCLQISYLAKITFLWQNNGRIFSESIQWNCARNVVWLGIFKKPKDWSVYLLRFFSTWWTKIILVAIFLIEKSFHFMFLPPHPRPNWFYTITYTGPDQLNVSAALYGQRRSLFPILQAREQSCHYINSVTEEHFFHFWGSRCISSHTPMQWQETHKHMFFFWEELGMLAGRKTVLAAQASPMKISFTVCTQMKNTEQRGNVCVLREHSRQ